MARVDGYERSTYGDAFADVYDDWYQGVSDVGATVQLLIDVAGRGALLELGVGTGRLAIPLAAAGMQVTGIDASAAMLDVLRREDAEGRITLIHGDMVGDLPPGPFDAALIAYNTVFNLGSQEEQRALFRAVAERLRPGAVFVVEAFVPDPERFCGDRVDVRSMEVGRVVLSISRHDVQTQRAEGQFVELVDGAPVRLRPWAIRWATPHQLDEMAAQAGLVLDRRLADMTATPFTDDSPAHVSIYRRPA